MGQASDGFDAQRERLFCDLGIRVTVRLGTTRHSHVYGAVADGCPAVLKVATDATMADPLGRSRFLREGRVGLSLHHPNLVETLRCGDDWILLADLRGASGAAPSLHRAAEARATIAPEAATARIAAVARALAYMHAKGLVHRDVKPSNILIAADGRPVLMDLGAVGFVGGDDLDEQELIGSPAWMAPEQLRGDRADGSSDVWSLAMIAAYLVCAVSPYVGTAEDVLRRRRNGGMPRTEFTAAVRNIPDRHLRLLIMSALADDTKARPAIETFTRLDETGRNPARSETP